MENRKATRIVRGRDAVDGAGVRLRRVLGLETAKAFDPFLMLDGFDSADPADYVRGFPWHPHRGIETVTYLLQGEMEHGDNLGHRGVIRSGECQWMTAGSGIIHQEMPAPAERMLGCQLWLNLPARHKMAKPSYRGITAADIPVVREENATVRIIAGGYGGKRADDGRYVRMRYIDVDLKPGAVWTNSDAANDETVFAYLFDGALEPFGARGYEERGCAILFTAGDKDASRHDAVSVKAGPEGARFALLSARPLGEPVAWGGPVVMNTQAELEEAFRELDNGTFIR